MRIKTDSIKIEFFFEIEGMEPYHEEQIWGDAKMFRPVMTVVKIWRRDGADDVTGIADVFGYRQTKSGRDYKERNSVFFRLREDAAYPDYVHALFEMAMSASASLGSQIGRVQ